jgi:K+-sensing histidine kinase KdpD
MRLSTRDKGRIALVFSLVGPLALALCLVPNRSQFAPAAAALVFVAMIVAAATLGTRGSGLIATASSAVWFDFFLTEPYGRFAISHHSDLETAICLVVVGAIVTEVVVRSHRHLRATADRSELVRCLYELGEVTSNSIVLSSVIDAASESLCRLLSLRECHFEPGPPVRRRPLIASDGEVVNGEILWPAHQIGIPGPEAEIPVRWGSHLLGQFVFKPTPGLHVPLAAVTLVRLVGAALTDPERVR